MIDEVQSTSQILSGSWMQKINFRIETTREKQSSGSQHIISYKILTWWLHTAKCPTMDRCLKCMMLDNFGYISKYQTYVNFGRNIDGISCLCSTKEILESKFVITGCLPSEWYGRNFTRMTGFDLIFIVFKEVISELVNIFPSFFF